MNKQDPIFSVKLMNTYFLRRYKRMRVVDREFEELGWSEIPVNPHKQRDNQ